MKRICLIGFGAMGSYVYAQVSAAAPHLEWSILAKEENKEGLQDRLGNQVTVLGSIEEAVDDVSDLIVECAGHAAVEHTLPHFLRRGTPAVLTSVGALADTRILEIIEAACREGQTQVTLVSGALGGLDALASASTAHMTEVWYRGCKSPLSWKGTAAEKLCDLAGLSEPTVFFQGSAREAAQMFPQNANVAAIVGLAGLGLDHTKVELIADPKTTWNTHNVVAKGDFGSMEITISALPFKVNPKTSALAGMSVVNVILRKLRLVVI